MKTKKEEELKREWFLNLLEEAELKAFQKGKSLALKEVRENIDEWRNLQNRVGVSHKFGVWNKIKEKGYIIDAINEHQCKIFMNVIIDELIKQLQKEISSDHETRKTPIGVLEEGK